MLMTTVVQPVTTTVVQPMTTTAETVTTTTKKPCPSGQFGPFEGTCYQLFDGQITDDNFDSYRWQEAEDNCVVLGGHLPSIHSQAQQDFIASISPKIGWIGIHYFGPGYMWTDGTPMDFTYWDAASNAPIAKGPDNCGYMNANFMNSRNWDTRDCPDTASAYVCALPQQ